MSGCHLVSNQASSHSEFAMLNNSRPKPGLDDGDCATTLSILAALTNYPGSQPPFWLPTLDTYDKLANSLRSSDAEYSWLMRTLLPRLRRTCTPSQRLASPGKPKSWPADSSARPMENACRLPNSARPTPLTGAAGEEKRGRRPEVPGPDRPGARGPQSD